MNKTEHLTTNLYVDTLLYGINIKTVEKFIYIGFIIYQDESFQRDVVRRIEDRRKAIAMLFCFLVYSPQNKTTDLWCNHAKHSKSWFGDMYL